MTSPFYLEDTYEFLEDKIENMFSSDDDHEEEDRSRDADHERLAERFYA